ASRASSRCLRFTARVALISGMVNTAEASAYTPTSMPMRDSDTPSPSVIWGRIPEGTSSDRMPTKVTLDIRPSTNHSGACSLGAPAAGGIDGSGTLQRHKSRAGRLGDHGIQRFGAGLRAGVVHRDQHR